MVFCILLTADILHVFTIEEIKDFSSVAFLYVTLCLNDDWIPGVNFFTRWFGEDSGVDTVYTHCFSIESPE